MPLGTIQVGRSSGENIGSGPRGSLWVKEERPAPMVEGTAECTGPPELPPPCPPGVGGRRGCTPAAILAQAVLPPVVGPQSRSRARSLGSPLARRLTADPGPGWPLLVEARLVVAATPEQISTPRNDLLCPDSCTGPHVIISPCTAACPRTPELGQLSPTATCGGSMGVGRGLQLSPAPCKLFLSLWAREDLKVTSL